MNGSLNVDCDAALFSNSREISSDVSFTSLPCSSVMTSYFSIGLYCLWKIFGVYITIKGSMCISLKFSSVYLIYRSFIKML